VGVDLGFGPDSGLCIDPICAVGRKGHVNQDKIRWPPPSWQTDPRHLSSIKDRSFDFYSVNLTVTLSLLPSPLLDLELVTKSQFDSIPDIHSQDDLPQKTVIEIGELFKKHKVFDQFGLHLLHRHFPLESGQLPVTTVLDDIIELTKLTPIDEILQHSTNGAFRGQLWYLNDKNRFQAYKYEYGPQIEFPQDFLQEFADYIRVNNLQKTVALSTSPSSTSTMEYELGTTVTVTVH